MTRPVPQLAVDFLKGAEGCRLTAYRDSGGVWTIGVGHTGPEVVGGLTITQAQADAYLFADATKAAVRLARVVTAEVLAGLTDHQYAALVSFVFNLGANPAWTIWKVLNARSFAGVPMQIMRFDKARVNGVLTEIPGLVHRRSAEVALWKTPDAVAAAAIVQAAPEPLPPSSEVRAADTPPTPMAAKPLAKSKSFVASTLTGAVALITPFADQAKSVLQKVADTLQPYIGGSDVIQHLHGELTTVLAGLAVLTTVLLILKNRESM